MNEEQLHRVNRMAERFWIGIIVCCVARPGISFGRMVGRNRSNPSSCLHWRQRGTGSAGFFGNASSAEVTRGMIRFVLALTHGS